MAAKKAVAPAAEPEPEPEPSAEPVAEAKCFIDLDWLKESLSALQAGKLQAWSESNLLEYIKTTYSVEAETVLKAVEKLDQGQSAHFVRKVEETLSIL